MNTLTPVAHDDETLRRQAREALLESGIRPGAVLAANPSWNVDPTTPRVTRRGRAFRIELVVRHRDTGGRQVLRLSPKDMAAFVECAAKAVTS